MKQLNRAMGIKGELLAKEYLIKKGYKILFTNYSTKLGEIDIVAKHKGYIIFVEVKQRETCAFGRPSEAVDIFKQEKIRRVATYFLKQYKLFDSDCRFDVIEIIGTEINHIENAF